MTVGATGTTTVGMTVTMTVGMTVTMTVGMTVTMTVGMTVTMTVGMTVRISKVASLGRFRGYTPHDRTDGPPQSAYLADDS
jgi:hypothetical protein